LLRPLGESCASSRGLKSLNRQRSLVGSGRLSTGRASRRPTRHVTDNVAAALGREAISFEQWTQQNAAAFV
jgi:hypothetical protein